MKQTFYKGTEQVSLTPQEAITFQGGTAGDEYGGLKRSGWTTHAPPASTGAPVTSGTQPGTVGATEGAGTPGTPPRPVYEQNQSPYQKAQDELFQRPERQSEASIREIEMQRARQQIEATKGVYLAELQKLQSQGAERTAQTSSIAVGAGLAGSPFQQQQEIKTGEYNAQVEGARQAERAAEISRIMNGGSDRAEKKFQDRRASFENERDAYLGQLKDRQDEARNSIATMAQSGLSIGDMDKAQYQQLLDDSGLSDFEARAIYDSNAPVPETSYQVSGGRIITISKDPRTGEITTNSEEIPGIEDKPDGSYTTKISGSNVVLIPDVVNSPDDIIIKPLGQNEPEDPMDALKLEEQRVKLEKLQLEVDNSTGAADKAIKEEKLRQEKIKTAQLLGKDVEEIDEILNTPATVPTASEASTGGEFGW